MPNSQTSASPRKTYTRTAAMPPVCAAPLNIWHLRSFRTKETTIRAVTGGASDVSSTKCWRRCRHFSRKSEMTYFSKFAQGIPLFIRTCLKNRSTSWVACLSRTRQSVSLSHLRSNCTPSSTATSTGSSCFQRPWRPRTSPCWTRQRTPNTSISISSAYLWRVHPKQRKSKTGLRTPSKLAMLHRLMMNLMASPLKRRPCFQKAHPRINWKTLTKRHQWLSKRNTNMRGINHHPQKCIDNRIYNELIL